MPDNPKKFDAVLGAKQAQPAHGLVLSGIEGVKHRLASDNCILQTNALSDALKYGDPGLDLVIKSLKHKSDDVRRKAFTLLCGRPEKKIQKALQIFHYKHDFALGSLQTLVGHQDSVNCVAVSPDGKTIFSGGSDGTIRVWDIETGKLKHTEDVKSGSINSLSVSLDGKTLVNVSNYHKITVWDIKANKIILQNTLVIQQGEIVHFVALSSDKQTIFCGTRHNSIQILDINTGSYKNLGGTQVVRAYAISDDRRIIVTGNNTINVWDTKTQKLTHTIQSPSEVKSLAISPNGKNLLGACGGKTIKWNMATGEPKYSSYYSLNALIICPNGQNFIGREYKNIAAYDINTGVQRFIVGQHSNRVTCLAISPNGGLVISGSMDGTIKVSGMLEW